MKNIRGSLLLIFLFFFVSFICSCTGNDSKNIVNPNPPPGNTNIIKDVAYAVVTDWLGNKITLGMDIYSPAKRDQDQKYPLVMHLHGGGYNDGDKSTAADKCMILADSGFIAVSVNYRLGWNSGSDADPCDGDTLSFNDAAYRAIQDANAALRFLVSKADEFNIDTNWIFLSGASAGATVILGSAYIDDSYAARRYPQAATKLGSLYSSGNNLKTSYKIKGICAIAGALPDSNLINSNRAYPAITFQGEEDLVIPIDHGTFMNCPNYSTSYGSLCQYWQLTRLNKSAIANFLPNEGHGDNGEAGFTNDFLMGNAACFFHNLMQKQSGKNAIYIGTQYSCD